MTTNKEYWWQERAVYNHVLPLIEYAKSELERLSDDDIYGENGLVERLMPYQRLYNDTMNQRSDRMKYATYGVCFVEDGSVDTDSLEADGVAPGSVVAYRQGSVGGMRDLPTNKEIGSCMILTKVIWTKILFLKSLMN